MPIERLTDIVIAQIAAGEVVERPASVVKELMENALDAGATTITVEAVQGGRRLIRVSDDGSGIPAQEVELAFARHATSKLRSADDLVRLFTLGFRGEALSSIASISRVTMLTRQRDEAMGTEIRLEGGALVRHQPAGVPAGTVIGVEDLFFNTPARLKFLKKETTEKRMIGALLTRYAMAYPGVRFIYNQDGREAFRSSGSGQLADVVVRAFGLESFQQLVEVASEEPPRDDTPAIQVSGYTSTPDLARGDRTQITLFVNGRWVQDSSLTYAVIQAYHTLLPNNRYPVTVLMVEIAPEEVDVNVHPTKAEVRFRQPDAVFQAVQRAVREAIVAAAQRPGERRFRTYEHDSRAVSMQTPRWNSHIQHDLGLSTNDVAPATDPIAVQDDHFDADTRVPHGPEGPRKPRTLPPLRVVGQVGAMYIVAEGPAGMYLIDQHAAHTRIHYEALREAIAGEGVESQAAYNSSPIDLTQPDADTIEQHRDLLQRCGLILEPFGPATVVARQVPTIMADRQTELRPLIRALAADLGEPGDAFEAALMCIASHAAVRAGQILNNEQMQAIVRRLERCQQPHDDPAGRATLIHLSGDQLAREFGRT